jgi:hypothetical protein
MTVTVFVWNMVSRGPDGIGVGHAAMHVGSRYGSIYVSFWPEEHSPKAAWSSPGKVHFVNADRLSDGTPHWASKPLDGLDEQAIIRWWSTIQHDPLIDYKHKKPFQLSTNKDTAFQAADNAQYRILSCQCATTVVAGLLAGANPALKTKIDNWVRSNAMSIGPVKIPLVRRWLNQTITPTDVKRLVISVWNDADYSRSFLDKIVSRF